MGMYRTYLVFQHFRFRGPSDGNFKIHLLKTRIENVIISALKFNFCRILTLKAIEYFKLKWCGIMT